MGTTDGNPSSRLDQALADVLASHPDDGAARHAGVPEPDDSWSVDDDDDELASHAPAQPVPEIVPATEPPATTDVAARAPAPPDAEPVAPAARPTAPARATAWGDHLSAVPASAPGATLRAPGRRPRVRRVTRVLRHIDPWSTFKVALLFSVVAYLVTLTTGVLLWRVADSTGTLDNVERWFTQFGWETFELKGGEIFHNAWIIGLFAAVALTGGLVLLATLFNLVSDIVGGVRLTVLEEEVVERTVSSTRRYVVRRSPVAGSAGDEPWDVDDDTEPASEPRASGSPSGDVGDDWSVDDDPSETSNGSSASDAVPS